MDDVLAIICVGACWSGGAAWWFARDRSSWVRRSWIGCMAATIALCTHWMSAVDVELSGVGVAAGSGEVAPSAAVGCGWADGSRTDGGRRDGGQTNGGDILDTIGVIGGCGVVTVPCIRGRVTGVRAVNSDHVLAASFPFFGVCV